MIIYDYHVSKSKLPLALVARCDDESSRYDQRNRACRNYLTRILHTLSTSPSNRTSSDQYFLHFQNWCCNDRSFLFSAGRALLLLRWKTLLQQ